NPISAVGMGHIQAILTGRHHLIPDSLANKNSSIPTPLEGNKMFKPAADDPIPASKSRLKFPACSDPAPLAALKRETGRSAHFWQWPQ
ncbi:MAG: hypothetical protein PHG75_06400, partial [Syntrophomonas sp.]|nr:hypothetical protein [Syntrophomonas sp.]